MYGLIWKDFLVLRKTLRLYVLFLLGYLGMALLGIFDLTFVTTFCVVILMILPISAFSYDEFARWDRYARTLPLSRLSEAVILPLSPDKGSCMHYDPSLPASVFLQNDLEMLLRMRNVLQS